jgi:hypothetical protein
MASLASRRTDGDEDVVGDRAAETVDADESWTMLVDAIELAEDPHHPFLARALDGAPDGPVSPRCNGRDA